MAIKQIRLAGQTILVEVTEAMDGDADEVKTDKNERGGLPATNVSRAETLGDVAAQIESTLHGLLTPIAQALAKAEPKEWAVELSLGFKGGAGIPFVVNGEANGAVKVTAKWVR